MNIYSFYEKKYVHKDSSDQTIIVMIKPDNDTGIFYPCVPNSGTSCPRKENGDSIKCNECPAKDKNDIPKNDSLIGYKGVVGWWKEK